MYLTREEGYIARTRREEDAC